MPENARYNLNNWFMELPRLENQTQHFEDNAKKEKQGPLVSQLNKIIHHLKLYSFSMVSVPLMFIFSLRVRLYIFFGLYYWRAWKKKWRNERRIIKMKLVMRLFSPTNLYSWNSKERLHDWVGINVNLIDLSRMNKSNKTLQNMFKYSSEEPNSLRI